MDIESFISRAKISMEYEPSEDNPDLHRSHIPENCDHYKCVFRSRTHEMEFHFTCLHGEDPPELKDAFRYLGAVASEYEDSDGIVEWANEYGFDPGHIDTRDAFHAIARISRDIWRLVGDELYEELRDAIQIEQAVEMAWVSYDPTRH